MPRKKQLTAYQKIKAAMRGHEQWVMATVKRAGIIRHPVTPSPTISKAIERLERAGKLRWRTSKNGFGGYVAVKKRKRKT